MVNELSTKKYLLRQCLSKYFFDDSSFTTKIMSQNYLKIRHREIENIRHDYIPKIVHKVPSARGDI